jgi:hypothetical protein
MKKTAVLASALRSTGAKTAASPHVDTPAADPPAQIYRPQQPSRKGTKPITAPQPQEVHRQLKTIAAEQGRQLDDVLAEAFNLLFARYRKPEIAPRKSQQGA